MMDRFQSHGWPLALTALTLAFFLVLLLTVPSLAGFAAGVFKACLGLALLVAFDALVLRRTDTQREIIEKHNVAYALVMLAAALIIAASVATAQPPEAPLRIVRTDGARPAWVTAALGEVGTVERGGPNRGARVEAYQRTVGLPPGTAWCAAFVRWALDAGGGHVAGRDGREIRSGVATVWLQGAGTIDAREVQRGARRPPRGSVVVWRRGMSWQGHAAVLDWWDRRCGETVEGNTSSGQSGSQRDGDGVWARTRCLSPGAYFRIVGFVPVRARAA